MSLPLSEAQEMLATSTKQIDDEVSRLEDSVQDLREEMKALKAQLYARFGKSINLD
jgi:prefoldin subunit 4